MNESETGGGHGRIEVDIEAATIRTSRPRVKAQEGRKQFLLALSETGNQTLACKASGLMRRQVSSLRERDPEFSASYDDAMEDAADLLEAEAWRRALDGVTRTVMNRGEPVIDPETNRPMVVRRFSDALLVMLLRGCKPEKFQTRGLMAAPTDPMAGIREIAADYDPPRAEPGHC